MKGREREGGGRGASQATHSQLCTDCVYFFLFSALPYPTALTVTIFNLVYSPHKRVVFLRSVCADNVCHTIVDWRCCRHRYCFRSSKAHQPVWQGTIHLALLFQLLLKLLKLLCFPPSPVRLLPPSLPGSHNHAHTCCLLASR